MLLQPLPHLHLCDNICLPNLQLHNLSFLADSIKHPHCSLLGDPHLPLEHSHPLPLGHLLLYLSNPCLHLSHFYHLSLI